jgi:hypothetical protein
MILILFLIPASIRLDEYRVRVLGIPRVLSQRIVYQLRGVFLDCG